MHAIAITPGEPAGSGPDIVLKAAMQDQHGQLIAVADTELLRERARLLDLQIELKRWSEGTPVVQHQPGTLWVLDVELATACYPGKLDVANASYVLETLELANRGVLDGTFSALVTAPVQKSILNDAGVAFSGHTEFLQQKSGGGAVVMMLASPYLKVALATTHLPLREVADALTIDGLIQTVRIVHRDLETKFGIQNPRILVAGLNPHAGEGGHLGREEIDIIEPALMFSREQGINPIGPLPADTLFTPGYLEQADAVLAMYHDQGLPVLKSQGFGESVNVTLGLPFIRTSVDHGTALDLAATGRADASSMQAAITMASQMVLKRTRAP